MTATTDEIFIILIIDINFYIAPLYLIISNNIHNKFCIKTIAL